MIRFCGRIAPGSGRGAVVTGHSLFANPAFTAATRARLSFFVRPLIVGTEIGGSFAESLVVAFEAVAGIVDEADAGAEDVLRESGLLAASATCEASIGTSF